MSKSNNAVALGIRRGGEWVGMAAAAAAVVAGKGFRWDGPPAHYVTHFFFRACQLAND